MPASAWRRDTPAGRPRRHCSPTSKNAAPVAVLGRGSKVIGGSIKTELTRDLLKKVVLDGFLPQCSPTDQPLRGAGSASPRSVCRTPPMRPSRDTSRGSWASRPARCTPAGRWCFPRRSCLTAASSKRRNYGGECLRSSQAGQAGLSPSWNPRISIWPWPTGAAYYGQVRRGRGVRIKGGVARAYYVGLETAAPAVPGVSPPIKALCVVPMGMEEGTEADVPGPEIGLIVGEPAQFRFLGSTTRRDDAVGTTLERWNIEELQELDPLETALEAEDGRSGEPVPVRLHSRITEVGTLELSCQSTRDPRSWKLEFNVRESSDA